jgi:mono/diheme cytochrome c family protein
MYVRRKILLAFGLILLAGGAALYWFVTSRGFSAREKPTWYEAWLARRARGLATERGARDLKNPVMATPLNVAEARDHYADHCAVCHANDGSGRTMIGHNMYPPAPDMREADTQNLTDGELFYIIRNGIRFTGMPGWGGEDEENWKLVHFIRRLPKLSKKELEFMNDINGLGSASEPADIQSHSGAAERQ